MSNTLQPGQYLGLRKRECVGEGFVAALRRATVPPDLVEEHGHAEAHIVLAIDESYLSAAGPAHGAMTLVYNPPGIVHRDRFAIAAGRFMSIDLDRALAPQARDPVVVRDLAARSALARMAGLIGEGDADPLELADLLLEALGAVAKTREGSSRAPAWLGRAAEAAGDLSGNAATRIGDIARAAGVHPVHLARMFRRHFGFGPGEALRRHRLARAAALIGRIPSLAEVALLAGFADQSHMTRAFRRHYGTTPARFRSAFL